MNTTNKNSTIKRRKLAMTLSTIVMLFTRRRFAENFKLKMLKKIFFLQKCDNQIKNNVVTQTITEKFKFSYLQNIPSCLLVRR